MVKMINSLVLHVHSVVAVLVKTKNRFESLINYRVFIKNLYYLHGLTEVNHLEYNLPLTRGAYHTDLGSKNSCYNKLHISYNQFVKSKYTSNLPSWLYCLEVVDFSKVGQIRSWSFLETCLGFGHMDPFRVLEIHSSSIPFC